MDFTIDPSKLAPADLVALQRELNAAGFDTGPADGRYGPRTRAAWQKALDAHDAAAPSFAGIIDINHANPFDPATAKARGVAAVIHKTSEGPGFVDPAYRARKAAAQAAGLLWGAYHFSSGDDGRAQAEHFLSVEDGTDPRVLLALDCEPSKHGNMNLKQAEDFVQTVRDRTGRWPAVYGGGGLLREAVTGRLDAVLAKCPLWLCDYRQHPQTIAPTWPAWWILQFKQDSDAAGWDWNRFAGTEADLRAAWPPR